MSVNSDMLRGFHDLMILFHLSNGETYGYELSKYFRDQTDGIYIIKETTLYSTFNRLEKRGLSLHFRRIKREGVNELITAYLLKARSSWNNSQRIGKQLKRL